MCEQPYEQQERTNLQTRTRCNCAAMQQRTSTKRTNPARATWSCSKKGKTEKPVSPKWKLCQISPVFCTDESCLKPPRSRPIIPFDMEPALKELILIKLHRILRGATGTTKPLTLLQKKSLRFHTQRARPPTESGDRVVRVVCVCGGGGSMRGGPSRWKLKNCRVHVVRPRIFTPQTGSSWRSGAQRHIRTRTAPPV